MSRERELLAECARVMRYVTLQPLDPNDTGSNNVDDQRAYYAALDAAERALLAEPAPEEEDETANVDWERVYHPELYATPPAPECDDDIHDELCDCNQARPDRGGNVSDRVQVPFTAAQQQNIQRWQDRGDVHPLTCPVNSTHGDLVPRKDGLHCLACGAVQTWCPWFIAEGM